ncbi:MAG: DUF4252 domain-containing protein [Muribaculaceae bacterium]|nr:DUF4252 domain-containing protein [Muribaculaceae bacterium]
MRTFLKSIVLIAILAMAGINANAQSTAVDKIAQLDDVYTFYMPSYMVKGLGNLGDIDILKATPIPTGILKKVKSMQFIMAGKKKVVKKAQKLLKDFDDTRKYQPLFRSSKNKEEKIAAYGYPAGYDVFNEVVFIINEQDRQLILLQFTGEFSMDDINDIEEEMRDDTPSSGKTTVTILDDDEAL